jgi:hypothetical protein
VLVIYDKWHNPVLQAFLKHDDTPDPPVAVLKGMYDLKAVTGRLFLAQHSEDASTPVFFNGHMLTSSKKPYKFAKALD